MEKLISFLWHLGGTQWATSNYQRKLSNSITTIIIIISFLCFCSLRVMLTLDMTAYVPRGNYIPALVMMKNTAPPVMQKLGNSMDRPSLLGKLDLFCTCFLKVIVIQVFTSILTIQFPTLVSLWLAATSICSSAFYDIEAHEEDECTCTQRSTFVHVNETSLGHLERLIETTTHLWEERKRGRDREDFNNR